jgi:hypothetical protein
MSSKLLRRVVWYNFTDVLRGACCLHHQGDETVSTSESRLLLYEILECVQILVKLLNIKFRKNPFSSCLIIICAGTDRQSEANRRILQLFDETGRNVKTDKPFEAEAHLNNILESSPCRKENTTLHHYKDQLVNAV